MERHGFILLEVLGWGVLHPAVLSELKSLLTVVLVRVIVWIFEKAWKYGKKRF